MTPEEAELVSLVKEWKDQIVTLTNDYSEAIRRLEEIKNTFNKKSWFERHKDWILPILIPATLTCVAITGFKLSDANIKIGDIEISKQQQCEVGG